MLTLIEKGRDTGTTALTDIGLIELLSIDIDVARNIPPP